MKIYTKIILDKNNNIIEEKYFEYFGSISNCGIHYTFGANKGSRLMEKKAKREKRLAEKRAKKQAKSGPKIIKNEDKTIPLNETVTLAHLTDPDNK
mgnify:FL=1